MNESDRLDMCENNLVEARNELSALRTENAALRNQVIAGIYDAASVGITLIKTKELAALRERNEAMEKAIKGLECSLPFINHTLKAQYECRCDLSVGLVCDGCELNHLLLSCRKLAALADTLAEGEGETKNDGL